MTKNKVQKNISNDSKSNEFIYGEVCKSHEQQQRDIEHLNNKLNWIIISNIAILIFIFKNLNSNSNNFITVSVVLLFVSFMFSILSLWTKTYKRGPKLIEMFEKKDWEYEKMLEKTNKALIKNIDSNQITIRELGFFIKVSIIFILLGFLVLIFNFLTV